MSCWYDSDIYFINELSRDQKVLCYDHCCNKSHQYYNPDQCCVETVCLNTYKNFCQNLTVDVVTTTNKLETSSTTHSTKGSTSLSTIKPTVQNRSTTSSPLIPTSIPPSTLTIIIITAVVLLSVGLAAFITVWRKNRNYLTSNIQRVNRANRINCLNLARNQLRPPVPNPPNLNDDEIPPPAAIIMIDNDNQGYLTPDSRTSTLSKNLEIEGGFRENRFLRVTIRDHYKIGCGCYGDVFEGKLYCKDNVKIPIRVAIKYAKDKEWELYLKDEAKILKEISDHINVVKFFDIDLVGKFGLVTGFCEKGDLKKYLQTTGLSLCINEQEKLINIDDELNELLNCNVLSKAALIMYAYQIANGMTFICEKKVIHRDLALRNTLLTNEHIVKISDFGLAHAGLEYKIQSNQKPLPTYYLAPESLDFNQKLFTSQSDVWSFGVVLWEIFSLGRSPHNHAPESGLREWFLNGNRYPLSSLHANDKIKKLMLECWSIEPIDRPNFVCISNILSTNLNRESAEFYSYISEKMKNVNE